MSAALPPDRGLTILCHFHNEEFFLPHWLRHHRRLFDHGVLVDRGSTDRSREIIAELAPGWEVVESRNPRFDARDCDNEMMELEAGYDGWKVVLNTTEFLFHEDPATRVREFERDHPETTAIGLGVIDMADSADELDAPVDDRPLFLQRNHGYFSAPHGEIRPGRFLHRELDGQYTPGRHTTLLGHVTDPDLLVLKFSWSPYRRIRARKLAIKEGLAASDIRQGLSWSHLLTADAMDAWFKEASQWSHDLREHGWYRDKLERLTGPVDADRAARPPRVTKRIDPPARRRRIAVIENPDAPERSRRIAAVLEADHDVRLLPAASVDLATAGELMTWSEVAVIAIDTLLTHPTLTAYGRAQVIDLVSPPPESAGGVGLLRPFRGHDTPVPLLDQLARGDFFLCSDPADRPAWAELIEASGRTELGRAGTVSTAVGPDATAAELQPLADFCAHPTRLGAAPFHDRQITMSETGFRTTIAWAYGMRENIAYLQGTVRWLEQRVADLEAERPDKPGG